MDAYPQAINEDLSVHRLKQSARIPSPLHETPAAVEAKREIEKKRIKDVINSQEKIKAFAQSTNRMLYKISTVFPFDLFPNMLIVEESRVNLIFWVFFAAKQIHTIDIKDITNVFLETAPFFATIRIVSRTFKENENSMGKLHKKEAARAKDIIEALRLMHAQHIDTTKFEKDQLMQSVTKLTSETTSEQLL